MIDENGKVVKMTPSQRKRYMSSKLGIPMSKIGLGQTLETKEIFGYLFRKRLPEIEQTLDAIKDIDPRTYLKTMIEMGKLSIIAEKQIDVNNRVSNDIKELEQLRNRKLPDINKTAIVAYTEFKEAKEVEVSPEPIPTEAISHPAIKEDLRELGLPPIPNKD